MAKARILRGKMRLFSLDVSEKGGLGLLMWVAVELVGDLGAHNEPLQVVTRQKSCSPRTTITRLYFQMRLLFALAIKVAVFIV